jgi:hypothetical protein
MNRSYGSIARLSTRIKRFEIRAADTLVFFDLQRLQHILYFIGFVYDAVD